MRWKLFRNLSSLPSSTEPCVRELGGKELLFPHAGNASHDPTSNRAREADPGTANILSDIADESYPSTHVSLSMVGRRTPGNLSNIAGKLH